MFMLAMVFSSNPTITTLLFREKALYFLCLLALLVEEMRNISITCDAKPDLLVLCAEALIKIN